MKPEESKRQLKICLDCGKQKSPKGNYCKACGYKHRVRPSGLTYKIVAENRSWFRKGLTPWNKGAGHMAVRGNKNPKWKGDLVGYDALHDWVRKWKLPSNSCDDCGAAGRLALCNLSYKYKRDVNDWVYLCYKCHNQMDRANGWGKAKEVFSFQGGKLRHRLC